MTEAVAGPDGYRRWQRGERERLDRPLQEAMAELRRLLPMGNRRFERLLGSAVADAVRRGSGFYLGGFAAKRALASRLVIDIAPSLLEHQLDHRVRQGTRAYSVRDKFVGAGDWTPLLHELRRSLTHREVIEIVAANYRYRDTRTFRRALDRSGTARPVKRNFVALSSPAKVERYFLQTTEMCRSIEQSGLSRRSDHRWRIASLARPLVRLPWLELGEVDIGVAIGAAGELYRFASGKHRTAAAQALKLPSMPVEIRMVHGEWLARQMAETGLAPVAALAFGIDTLALASR